jgi:hypothetical protein
MDVAGLLRRHPGRVLMNCWDSSMTHLSYPHWVRTQLISMQACEVRDAVLGKANRPGGTKPSLKSLREAFPDVPSRPMA